MVAVRTVVVSLAGWAAAANAAQMNLQTPVTPVARDIYQLHTLMLIITIAVAVIVFGVMLYAILRHRKSLGHDAQPFHKNTVVEILWTVIPFLILLGMAYPATMAVLEQKSAAGSTMTIKVTAYQWKWRYDYLEDKLGFMSNLATPPEVINAEKDMADHAGMDHMDGMDMDHTLPVKQKDYLLAVDEPLVVPTGTKIRLLLTSNDVIHAWSVPALGVKQDVVPGFVRETWFLVDKPGVYRGQCMELCGTGHAFMPIVVDARPPAEYRRWLAAKKQAIYDAAHAPKQTWTLAKLKQHGQEVYQKNCQMCHQANGKGIPGTFPALDGSPIVNRDVKAHINIVLHGSSKNPAMAAWGKMLSDEDIAAVITYERNAWDNHTGQMVLPKDILAARGGSGK